MWHRVARLVRLCAAFVAASDAAPRLSGSVPASVAALVVRTAQIREQADVAVGISDSRMSPGTADGVRRKGRSVGRKAGAAVVAGVRDVLATAARRLRGDEKTTTYGAATLPSDAPQQTAAVAASASREHTVFVSAGAHAAPWGSARSGLDGTLHGVDACLSNSDAKRAAVGPRSQDHFVLQAGPAREIPGLTPTAMFVLSASEARWGAFRPPPGFAQSRNLSPAARLANQDVSNEAEVPVRRVVNSFGLGAPIEEDSLLFTGKNPVLDKSSFNEGYGRRAKWPPGAARVFAGHYKVWEDIIALSGRPYRCSGFACDKLATAENSDEWFLVSEDDAVWPQDRHLPRLPDPASCSRATVGRRQADPDAGCFLTFWTDGLYGYAGVQSRKAGGGSAPPGFAWLDTNVFPGRGIASGTVGYAITRKFAQHLVSALRQGPNAKPAQVPVDHYLFHEAVRLGVALIPAAPGRQAGVHQAQTSAAPYLLKHSGGVPGSSLRATADAGARPQ